MLLFCYLYFLSEFQCVSLAILTAMCVIKITHITKISVPPTNTHITRAFDYFKKAVLYRFPSRFIVYVNVFVFLSASSIGITATVFVVAAILTIILYCWCCRRYRCRRRYRCCRREDPFNSLQRQYAEEREKETETETERPLQHATTTATATTTTTTIITTIETAIVKTTTTTTRTNVKACLHNRIHPLDREMSYNDLKLK